MYWEDASWYVYIFFTLDTVKEMFILMKLEILIGWLGTSYSSAWFPLRPVLGSHKLCFWTNRSFFSPPCFLCNYHPNPATNLWTGSNELSAHLEQSNVLTSQINSLLAKHSFSMDQKVSGQEERRAENFITLQWHYMRSYTKTEALHNYFTEYLININTLSSILKKVHVIC